MPSAETEWEETLEWPSSAAWQPGNCVEDVMSGQLQQSRPSVGLVWASLWCVSVLLCVDLILFFFLNANKNSLFSLFNQLLPSFSMCTKEQDMRAPHLNNFCVSVLSQPEALWPSNSIKPHIMPTCSHLKTLTQLKASSWWCDVL